jgi:hypothetical protein
LTIPESKCPSGAPGDPEVTVCGAPENVQETVSPTLTEIESGANWKFLTAIVDVLAPVLAGDRATVRAKASATMPTRRRADRVTVGTDAASSIGGPSAMDTRQPASLDLLLAKSQTTGSRCAARPTSVSSARVVEEPLPARYLGA